MMILSLTHVQYLAYIAIKKGSNDGSHSSSDSHHPIKKTHSSKIPNSSLLGVISPIN